MQAEKDSKVDTITIGDIHIWISFRNKVINNYFLYFLLGWENHC